MKYFFLFFVLFFNFLLCQAQDHVAKILVDPSTNCRIKLNHNFSEDSMRWSGTCKDLWAEGSGEMIAFTQGKQTAHYIGEMKSGVFNGTGDFSFWNDRRLKGFFKDGEALFLSAKLRDKLTKNKIAASDPSNAYVGDNDQKEIFYHAIIPSDKCKGVVVLMPGTWEITEHVLSSMSEFCELAYANQIAIIVPSINQRLTLTDTTLHLMNAIFTDAIQKYQLPKNRFILGGFSMGGIFSMRYTEFSKQDSTLTVVQPLAIINCDGPCDLNTLYNNFKRKLYKNPGQNEPFYGMKEMEKYCGGTPEHSLNKYEFFSPFSHNRADGGNAKYLKHTPLRIYTDVDPNWWMKNRHVDVYDMNALDQSAMIQWLNDNGNEKAEFINAFQKGKRIEGNRHPHSWSLIDPNECMEWIIKILVQ